MHDLYMTHGADGKFRQTWSCQILQDDRWLNQLKHSTETLGELIKKM